MTHLLDTNVVSYFFAARREEELRKVATVMPIAIVRKVEEEALVAKSFGSRFKKWLPTTGIEVREIALGSNAHLVLAALGGAAVSGKNGGERASIALASDDDTLTFVANDKNAMWIALRELHARGERVIGLPVFLRRLHEGAALRADALDDVLAASSHPTPTWWASWRSNVDPSS